MRRWRKEKTEDMKCMKRTGARVKSLEDKTEVVAEKQTRAENGCDRVEEGKREMRKKKRRLKQQERGQSKMQRAHSEKDKDGMTVSHQVEAKWLLI